MLSEYARLEHGIESLMGDGAIILLERVAVHCSSKMSINYQDYRSFKKHISQISAK